MRLIGASKPASFERNTSDACVAAHTEYAWYMEPGRAWSLSTMPFLPVQSSIVEAKLYQIIYMCRQRYAENECGKLSDSSPRSFQCGAKLRGYKNRAYLCAIVRHPQVFLMDGPSLNLDAKPRNQMRTARRAPGDIERETVGADL